MRGFPNRMPYPEFIYRSFLLFWNTTEFEIQIQKIQLQKIQMQVRYKYKGRGQDFRLEKISVLFTPVWEMILTCPGDKVKNVKIIFCFFYMLKCVGGFLKIWHNNPIGIFFPLYPHPHPFEKLLTCNFIRSIIFRLFTCTIYVQRTCA